MHQLLVLGLTLVTFPGDGNVTMVKPPALEEGATIGIVAPASSLDEANVQRAIRNIQRRGYRVKLSLGYRQRQGYLAADDTVRAGELNSFFADPEVDAILCLRGGYGSPRILDQVDYDLARRNPKILIGYSDITALLLALHRRSGLVTFHGPMANNFAAGKGLTPYTEKWYWPAFRAGSTGFKKWGGKGPRGSGAMATMVTGRADGILVGGHTVETDDPRLTLRHVPGDDPRRFILSGRGHAWRQRPEAKVFQSDGSTLLCASAALPDLPPVRDSVTVIGLPAENGRIDIHDVNAAIAATGTRSLFVEGGGATLSSFLDAGLIDILHLHVAPRILGSGVNGFRLPEVKTINEGPLLHMTHYELEGELLFECRCPSRAPISAAIGSATP